MTIRTETDPAATVRGRGALPGRRADSKLSLGGKGWSGKGHLVGGGLVPIRDTRRRPTGGRKNHPPVAPVAPVAPGAGRGR
jgi:hypothetical protein